MCARACRGRATGRSRCWLLRQRPSCPPPRRAQPCPSPCPCSRAAAASPAAPHPVGRVAACSPAAARGYSDR
eukprot:1962877-Prymnesium_polylepis.1